MSNLEIDAASDDRENAADASRPSREGLPPAYRMRADRHYVDELTSESPSFRTIPLEDIDPPDGLEGADVTLLGALIRSVRTLGVLHPLLVRAEGGRYQIIAGRRRFVAARAAGLTAVPCLVHRTTPADVQALADADDLRCAPPADLAIDGAAASQSLALLKSLGEELSGIQSARNLLAREGPTVAWRTALELLNVHTARAQWIVNASRFVEASERSDGRRPLGCLIDDLVEQFAPEGRLRGISLRARVDDKAYSARFGAHALSLGLTGAVVALLPFLDSRDEPALMVSASRSTSSFTVDFIHHATKLDATSGERFLDGAWTTRPGGWPAALGVLALKRAVDHHGGEAVCEVR